MNVAAPDGNDWDTLLYPGYYEKPSQQADNFLPCLPLRWNGILDLNSFSFQREFLHFILTSNAANKVTSNVNRLETTFYDKNTMVKYDLEVLE